MQNLAKVLFVAVLSLGLTSCFVTGQEEADVALAKWHGKKINDFFFTYGKGEFQAQNSQGEKAYIWRSPKRQITIAGTSKTVRVADKLNPGQFVEQIIISAPTYEYRQCVLRIVTTDKGKITRTQNVNGANECARYFSLSKAEIDAILAARK